MENVTRNLEKEITNDDFSQLCDRFHSKMKESKSTVRFYENKRDEIIFVNMSNTLIEEMINDLNSIKA